MGTGVILPLLFLLAQCADCWYSPGANKLCLSCSHVTDPNSCIHFVEARSNEVCTTERLILLNGSTVWNFGFEDDEGCNENDVRVRRSSEFGYLVCHECCYTDLCNHKLCGSSSDNDLACLVGEEGGRAVPSDGTDIVYCNEGDLCYAGQSTDSRPGHFHYGCASQPLCNQLPSHDVHDTCQRCCNTDGCNAHACDVEVSVTQNPTDVTVNGTASPTLGDDMFHDCWDLHTRGHFNQTGNYDVYPPPDHSRLRVHCYMTFNGAGWSVAQYYASVDFNRTFDEYARATCGNRPYDMSSQICCNGVVRRSFGTTTGCCGNQAMEFRNDLCCNLHVRHRIGISSGCCGIYVFSPRYQNCCHGGHVC